MTSYETTSLHVEDASARSLAFTTYSDTASSEIVMRVWHTHLLPDGQPIEVEVLFTADDVRDLRAFLTDQFGSRNGDQQKSYPYKEADAVVLGPECFKSDSADHRGGICYKGEWYYAGAVVPPQAVPLSDVQQAGQVIGVLPAGQLAVPAPGWAVSEYRCPDGVATCKRTDSHHHMLDASGVHWVHDGTASECPQPDNHYPLSWRPSDNDLPGMWSNSDFTGGQFDNERRQCPVIYDGVQCSANEGHGPGHSFAQVTYAPTGNPANEPGDDLPPTGLPQPAEAEQPAPEPEKPKRKRRTKLEIAYDKALEAYNAEPTQERNAEFQQAAAVLRAKDPDNERLETPTELQQVPEGQPDAARGPSFAPEPLQPGAQPVPGQVYAPDASGGIPAQAFEPRPIGSPAEWVDYAAAQGSEPRPIVPPLSCFTCGAAVGPLQDSQDPVCYADPSHNWQAPVTVTEDTFQDPGSLTAPAYAQMQTAVRQEGGDPVTGEALAARAFPCPTMHSDGVRQCVRPYGHEIESPANPEPKPHMYATDVATLDGIPATAVVHPGPPTPPAAPAPTAFLIPPVPAQQPAVHPEVNLQPPAPAAPFWQQP